MGTGATKNSPLPINSAPVSKISSIRLLCHAIISFMSTQSTNNLLNRITVNPEQCGGRPCIRNMRIRVSDVLDLLATGLNISEIVQELPDLEPEDVKAAILYASRRIDHVVIAA